MCSSIANATYFDISKALHRQLVVLYPFSAAWISWTREKLLETWRPHLSINAWNSSIFELITQGAAFVLCGFNVFFFSSAEIKIKSVVKRFAWWSLTRESLRQFVCWRLFIYCIIRRIIDMCMLLKDGRDKGKF